MKLVSPGEAAANSNDIPAEAGEEFVRIGEMAKKYGVTLRTLRFYEDKGLLNPKRDGSTRLYTRRDRARLPVFGERLGRRGPWLNRAVALRVALRGSRATR